MSRKNPNSHTTPEVVLELANALEKKLGRPPYIRQVNNMDEWYVTDLVFSYIQSGLRKGMTGYRVGYRYIADDDSIQFYLVHSPVMAEIFKRNLSVESLAHVVKATAQFRSLSYLHWSSRLARKEKDGEKKAYSATIHKLEEVSASDFVRALHDFDAREGFVKDLFPKAANATSRVAAGNDFWLLLAEDTSALSRKDVTSLVRASWPLFLCLYPIAAIEKRSASLARSLKAAKLKKECEYAHIKNTPKSAVISTLCRGEVEGAHIKPHAIGGTDRMTNGLWLCQYHHRQTEGHLTGSRAAEALNVRFVA